MSTLLRLITRCSLLIGWRLFGGLWYARKVGVKFGEGCRIYSVSFGSEPFLVELGDRVTITSGVVFLTHDGAGWLVRDGKGRRYRYARIAVGDDVFVGINAILLPGVRIGSRVIVGAGSVVTKSVPSGVVVAGNPAVVIGEYDDFENKALEHWVSDDLIDRKKSYQKRIQPVVETEMKSEMLRRDEGASLG